MTVTASGAITFSNLMNEFNSSGGQSNIKLGDYIARYPDNFGGIQEDIIYVAWTGQHFTIQGVSGAFFPYTYFSFPGKLRIRFLLQSTVNVPFYVSTTDNTSGSNLASGVSNNGAVYDASSSYHGGGYTHVVCDLSTAAGGTSESIGTNIVYLNTNTQQTVSGTNYTPVISSFPDTNRLVTMNRPYCDVTLNSSYSGGSESGKVSGGSLFTTSVSPQRVPGMIPPGQSITSQMTVSAYPSVTAGGMAPSVYVGYFYAINWSGPVGQLGGGWNTTGSAGYFRVYPYTGSGNGYINGGPTSGGNIPNTASGVGQYLRSGNSGTIANVYNGIPSTGTFSVSWGGSGSTVSCTVTNNSSDWYYFTPFYQPNGGARYQTFYTNYFDSGSNNQFTLQTNWGGTASTQRFGQNTRPSIRFARDLTSGSATSDYSFTVYMPASANRSTVTSTYSNLINTAGNPGFSSQSPPGGSAGSGTGSLYASNTVFPYIYNNYPSTGTMRFRSRASIGGTYKATSNASGVFSVSNITPGWDSALGGSNETATASYSTGTSNLEDNAFVKINKQNMKLSHYYGTKNLGTDGG